jgi:hypothetical protein
MAAKTIRKAAPNFEAAISQFWPILRNWRLKHKPPERIPEELWGRMTRLAAEYGVGAVARALRIDYNALKRRLVATGAQVTSGGGAVIPGFVEVPMTAWPHSQSVIELADPRGSKLTLRLPGWEMAGVMALAQGLWKQRA